jgi:chemotaxis family two-component system response regulator Rcp1
MNILLVEDNPADVRLVREACAEAGVSAALHWVADGVAALDFLRRGGLAEAALPDLVLLDLNLPGLGGQELLAEIKGDPALATVPVVVLTSSAARRDVLDCYRGHANAYMVKPTDFDAYLALVRLIDAHWLRGAVLLPTRTA